MNALVSKGIPKENIVIIPSNANSTKDEAIAIRKYVESNLEINSIILISSPTDLRRAGIIFLWSKQKLIVIFQSFIAPANILIMSPKYGIKKTESRNAVLVE